jgi:hypothetical protein
MMDVADPYTVPLPTSPNVTESTKSTSTGSSGP